jgi:hypothetical protein
MMTKVYIASPYTIGDQAANVRRQIDCFDELLKLDFVPFAPLFTHFQHLVHPADYEVWMNWDFEWVKCCDAILRLSGESPGADREVELAKAEGIPVFYSIEDLVAFFKTI